jgi:hypothetical protein
MKKLIAIACLFISLSSFSQADTLKYKGTFNGIPTIFKFVITVTNKGCLVSFDGMYFSKKLKKDITFAGKFDSCARRADPDAPILMDEMNGDVMLGKFLFFNIGEEKCLGEWVSADEKKHANLNLILQKEKKK